MEMRKRDTIGSFMFAIAAGIVAGCGSDDTSTTVSPAVQQCIAGAPAPTECVECACTSCLDEIMTCDATPGCPEIRGCGERTGCSGADCYSETTCRQVIDSNGGPFGAGASTALTVGQCADAAGCPCSAP
jgi:hypothetical protein